MVYHYHNNHLGTPQELTDDCGEVVWCNYEWAWGGTYQRYYKEQSLNGTPIDKDHLQPLKFQGQFFDPETGLHYNRFRYYDSDVGMFIQRDPIGLLGGVSVYWHVDNQMLLQNSLYLTRVRNVLQALFYNACSILCCKWGVILSDYHQLSIASIEKIKI